jgi:type II secretion system (T2SS) protein E
MGSEMGSGDGEIVDGEESVSEERADARRLPLGALLVEAGVASEAQVHDALDEGNWRGERLGQVVLRRGWLSERKLAKLLAEQWGLKASDKLKVDPAAVAQIDAALAAELGGVPVAFDEHGLVVAVAEPKRDRFSAFRARLGNVSFVVVPASTLAELLASDAMFGKTSSPVDRVGAWLAPNDMSPQIVAGPDRSQASLDSDNQKEEPMSSIEELQQEAQQAAHEPSFAALPQPASVVEHLHGLIRAVEALEHELTETRRRLQAQETELAELRRARASDRETISNLGAELEERRSRMEAFQAAARELAAELDR